MKMFLLKVNAFITFILEIVVMTCLAFAAEGSSPIQEWVIYAGYAFLMEIVVWICIGVCALVRYIRSAPAKKRGYIRYSEQYGWTDAHGKRL